MTVVEGYEDTNATVLLFNEVSFGAPVSNYLIVIYVYKLGSYDN